MSKFNDVTLIQLIKSKPCLWDRKNDDYTNRDVKQNSWNKICCDIYGNAYEDMPLSTQKRAMNVVVSKWINIKDSFIRSLKDTTGISKYIYDEHLQFLKKAELDYYYYNAKIQTQCDVESEIHKEDNNESEPSRKGMNNRKKLDFIQQKTAKVVIEKLVNVDQIFLDNYSNFDGTPQSQCEPETTIYKDDNTESELSMQIIEESPIVIVKHEVNDDEIFLNDCSQADGLSRVEIQVQCQTESEIHKEVDEATEPVQKTKKRRLDSVERESSKNDDESFFNSLLPTVRKFSEEDKLDFRIDVLNLIKRTRKDHSERYSRRLPVASPSSAANGRLEGLEPERNCRYRRSCLDDFESELEDQHKKTEYRNTHSRYDGKTPQKRQSKSKRNIFQLRYIREKRR